MCGAVALIRSRSALARSIFFNQRSFNKDTPFASVWSGTASTTLAPDIVMAIINGEETDGLSLARLTRSFPSEWSEPRTLLDFGDIGA